MVQGAEKGHKILAASERADILQHVQEVLDDVFAMYEVDALEALVRQVAGVAGLPKGHQQGRRPQHLLQRRRHLRTDVEINILLHTSMDKTPSSAPPLMYESEDKESALTLTPSLLGT